MGSGQQPLDSLGTVDQAWTTVTSRRQPKASGRSTQPPSKRRTEYWCLVIQDQCWPKAINSTTAIACLYTTSTWSSHSSIAQRNGWWKYAANSDVVVFLLFCLVTSVLTSHILYINDQTFTGHVIYMPYSFSTLKSSATWVSCKIRSILVLCWFYDSQQIKQTWTSTSRSASVAETLSSKLVTFGPRIQGPSWRSTSA